jgi:hypothetical protein
MGHPEIFYSRSGKRVRLRYWPAALLRGLDGGALALGVGVEQGDGGGDGHPAADDDGGEDEDDAGALAVLGMKVGIAGGAGAAGGDLADDAGEEQGESDDEREDGGERVAHKRVGLLAGLDCVWANWGCCGAVAES